MRICNKVPPKKLQIFTDSHVSKQEKKHRTFYAVFYLRSEYDSKAVVTCCTADLWFSFKRFFLMSFSPEGFPLMRIVMGKWEGLWVWMVPWTGAVFVRYRAKMMSNTVAGCGLRMPCRCIRHTPPQTHACLWKQEWLLSSTTLRCPINIFVQAFVCVQAS